MASDRYNYAKELYAKIGVDTDEVLKKLASVQISMQCWQGDDVQGFDSDDALSGGIQATGNYPGRARTPQELMQDIDVAFSLIPGKHRVNLHSSYAVFDGNKVDRDRLEPEHFAAWVDFAKERGIGLDINPTLFSHPMAADSLTLSSPDEKVRRFWIDHCKAMRKVGAYFGKELGTPALNNIWIPDGYKQTPADRVGPRQRLKEALDEILSVEYDKSELLDSLESKLFGIGLESYTVGSSEFYMNYCAKNNLMCLLDAGHYHPTEVISDKIAALLVFSDKVALHVSRGVRWDSDHVVNFDDELKEIAKEIVRNDALDRVIIGLDYFDASINRIAAWVIGMRNMMKALLYALLTPNTAFKQMQDEGRFTELLAMTEELKSYPFADVWDEFCAQQGVPVRDEWIEIVQKYENEVLAQRG